MTAYCMCGSEKTTEDELCDPCYVSWQKAARERTEKFNVAHRVDSDD